MNQLQENYLNLKNQMEALENAEKWDEVDEIEDPFLDAEEALIHWAIDNAEKAGMSKEDAEFLRMNWTRQVDKVTDLALRLTV